MIPQVWSRLELVAYKEKVYLIKYFPLSFYNRDNVSGYEVVDGWGDAGCH